jgi:hypothetical protein
VGRVLSPLCENELIAAGNAIENRVERYLSTFRIAPLAGFDQTFGFAKDCAIDEHNDRGDAIDY